MADLGDAQSLLGEGIGPVGRSRSSGHSSESDGEFAISCCNSLLTLVGGNLFNLGSGGECEIMGAVGLCTCVSSQESKIEEGISYDVRSPWVRRHESSLDHDDSVSFLSMNFDVVLGTVC